jgi:hypothetical protein
MGFCPQVGAPIILPEDGNNTIPETSDDGQIPET